MTKPDTSWTDCLLHLMSRPIASGELGDVLTRFLMSSRNASELKALRVLLAPLDLAIVRSDAQSRDRFSLAIPPDGDPLTAVYAATPWAFGGKAPWRNTLLNGPASVIKRRTTKINGRPCKAIVVSLQPALDALGFSIIWTPAPGMEIIWTPPRPDQL